MMFLFNGGTCWINRLWSKGSRRKRFAARLVDTGQEAG